MYRPPCQRPRRSGPTANLGSRRRRRTGPRHGRGAALLFTSFAVFGLGGRGQATPISFQFDDYRYGGSTFTIDSYQVEHVPGGILAGAVEAWAPVEVSLQRADSTGMTFDTDVVPSSPDELSDFPGFRDFRLSFGENLDASPHVSDPGSSFAQVPEPSTGWLLAAGLTGLVACRRRCRPSV